ncbi:hypothetical protein HGRIS_000493 [Hohenbuehelia grisea]|uniref:RING-type E3 ubiquitin transferase n=1 Tax=Hohenbuehelia grisea TaxID=104357 RepID=A0ABR3JT53_9AGAR
MSRHTRGHSKPGSISIRTITAFDPPKAGSNSKTRVPRQSHPNLPPDDAPVKSGSSNLNTSSPNDAGPSIPRNQAATASQSTSRLNSPPDCRTTISSADPLTIPNKSPAGSSKDASVSQRVPTQSRPKYSIVVDDKVYITVPTKARIPEICRKYLENDCYWDASCDRIHLRDEVSRDEIEYLSKKLTEVHRDALRSTKTKKSLASSDNALMSAEPTRNSSSSQKGKLPASVYELPRVDDVETSSQSTQTITERSATFSRSDRGSTCASQGSDKPRSGRRSQRRGGKHRKAKSDVASTGETLYDGPDLTEASSKASKKNKVSSEPALSDILAQSTWNDDPAPDPNMWVSDKDAWDDTGQSSISTDDSTKDFWGHESAHSAASSLHGHATSETRSTSSWIPPHICRLFQRGKCFRGPLCRYQHITFVPQPLEKPKIASSSESKAKVNPKPEFQAAKSGDPLSSTVTIFDHNRVTIGPGLQIEKISTGFETPWIVIENLDISPSSETSKAVIIAALEPYGRVEDVRFGRFAKVLFSSPEEALQVAREVNGKSMLGVNKLSVRLSLDVANARSTNGVFSDTTIMVTWDAPAKIAYAGYETMQRARVGITIAHSMGVPAVVHSGLPAVGMVTVRFDFVPIDADTAYMEQFGRPDDVMWQQPKYPSIDFALRTIRSRLVMNDEDPDSLISFDVPPAKDRVMKAYAQFTSAEQAKAAATRLHGWKPASMGRVVISSRHLQSVSYTMPTRAYQKIESDLHILRNTLRSHRGSRITLSVIPRSNMNIIRFNADDLKDLVHYKSEFEVILRGEVVRQNGKLTWDPFFGTLDGIQFLRDIEARHPGVTAERDLSRRAIKLYGPRAPRIAARLVIINKLNELREAQTRSIPLERSHIGLFMSPEVVRVKDKLGRASNGLEMVWLDITRRVIRVRGDVRAYEEVHEALRVAQQKRASLRQPSAHTCPVCLDEMTLPTSLRCGHRYCRACLAGYLVAASDGGSFPLMCLGDTGKCPELIQLPIMRYVLPPEDWETLVQAAFFSYVNARPDEFHFCPTPDCQQIYRVGPKGTVLQCPACLQRICAYCHAEGHEGRPCAERDAGDKLLMKWMKEHDVKSCPGCRVPIERGEGCNHITCTQCKTHICWVCMDTFTEGNGIYEHMRTMHGGIGLAVWEVLIP